MTQDSPWVIPSLNAFEVSKHQTSETRARAQKAAIPMPNPIKVVAPNRIIIQTMVDADPI
jgi:hypothetical protein